MLDENKLLKIMVTLLLLIKFYIKLKTSQVRHTMGRKIEDNQTKHTHIWYESYTKVDGLKFGAAYFHI